MESANWEVQGAGIDYITLTGSSPKGMKVLKDYADAQFLHLERLGFHVKPSAPMGYQGWQVGPVFGGARQDGYMLRVSGQDAQQAYQACFCDYVHCTRLDLQLTLRSLPGLPGWAKWSAYGIDSLRSQAKPCNWARPHFHDNFGHGDTLNIGARQSDKYGRLYDKEMESLDPNYERCWRYEVEYKGDYAVSYARRLATSSNISQDSAAIVLGQWQAWCVPTPKVSITVATPLAIDTIETDLDRKLAWLHKQVAPTVRKLAEAGRHEDIDKWLAACYDGVIGS